MTNNRIIDNDVLSKPVRSPAVGTWYGYVLIPKKIILFSALSGDIYSPPISLRLSKIQVEDMIDALTNSLKLFKEEK
jgi:hypothetical protein